MATNNNFSCYRHKLVDSSFRQLSQSTILLPTNSICRSLTKLGPDTRLFAAPRESSQIRHAQIVSIMRQLRSLLANATRDRNSPALQRATSTNGHCAHSAAAPPRSKRGAKAAVSTRKTLAFALRAHQWPIISATGCRACRATGCAAVAANCGSRTKAKRRSQDEERLE